MTQPAYRPDIDGLRSVAVVPVVLFHLGLEWVPGGFVGVDVFFVISGFLITRIIARELDEGRFSLLGFYERRIRRILPALLLVIAVTLAVAAVIFVPSDLKNAAQSAVAAILFSANILFYHEAGYFDVDSFQKPLLHTWSLGVEEQFYIVLPLLMILLSRLGRRFIPVVGIIAAASLALSILTTTRLPTEAYYLLPWRGWELGIGALLALKAVPPVQSRALRELMAGAGLALILGAALTLSRMTPFPGTAALVPTLGAALILHAGASGPSAVSRLLSTAGPVWIGRLSYSLYLWHWPVIVVFVYVRMALPGPLEATALFGLSLLLSALGWRFVEQPLRHPKPHTARRRVFAVAGLSMATAIACAGVIVVTKGLPARLPGEVQRVASYSFDYPDRMGACFHEPTQTQDWSSPCLYGDGTVPARIAIWGDSQAPALIPAFDGPAREAGVSVALFAHDGCPPIRNFQVYWTGQSHDCLNFVSQSFDAILSDPETDVVVIMLRPAIYTQGWTRYGLVERHRSALLVGDATTPLPASESRTRFFLEGLEQTVTALRSAGKQVALVYPLPEAGFPVPDAIVRRAMLGGLAQPDVLPRALYDSRTAEVIAGYDAMVERHQLLPIRLDQLLCDAEGCGLTLEGVPLYRDGNHLSKTAAELLAPEFSALLELAQQERHVER